MLFFSSKLIFNRSADFLSSIETLIVDQADVMTMQNWEHVQFVLSNLNELPKEGHDTDFSRVKPWYLDGQCVYCTYNAIWVKGR